MANLRAALLMVSLVAGCGGGAAQTEPAPVAAGGADDTAAVAPECTADADCVATRFDDCCSDDAGECACDWYATSRSDLAARQEQCAEEECSVGACPPCPEEAPPSAARCTEAGACRL